MTGEQNSPKVGTSSVRAPELLLHSTSYSFPVDLWSMGCLMGSFFQPLCLPMFLGNSDAELLFAICRILGKISFLSSLIT